MKNHEEVRDSNVIHLDNVQKIRKIDTDSPEEEDIKADDELKEKFKDSFDKLLEELKPKIIEIMNEDIKRHKKINA